jgi:Tfp pilus assembly protein PilF
LKPDLERALELVLAQALARAPGRRFASARDLARDLQRYLDGEPVLARRPPALVRAADWIRAFPLRSLAAAALLLLALVAAGMAYVAQEERAATRRTQLDRLLDRAYWAWVQGDEQRARREASAALRLQPHAEDARALLAHLGANGEVPSSPDMTRGLAAYQAQRYEEAGLHFAVEHAAHPRSLPAAFLAARCARLDGEPAEARERLDAAVARWPASSSLAAELAAVHADSGAKDAALRESRRAAELDPSDPYLRAALARLLLAAGQVREGVLLAHEAAALAVRQGEGVRLELNELLDTAQDMAAVRRELAELLAADPGRIDTRFALATSLDNDHQVAEARAQYEEVLRRDPRHLDAMVHLAWLCAGANRERCETCRVVFEAAPELLDPERAQELLVGALQLDQGRDEALLKRIVNIATDKGFVPAVTQALERQVAVGVAGTAHSQRLESALRRLRNASGPRK